MAAGAYSAGVKNIINGTIDLDTSVLKIMLVNSSYVYDPDHPNVNAGSTSANLLTNEIVATNYTGAFGGAGRKTATVTITEQTANNRVVAILANLTWTALGGATNATIQAGVLIREITNDAASIPIAFLDFVGGNVVSNGSDITLSFDQTNGQIRFSV